MHVDEICAYCRSFPGACERFPFGPTALVFAVEGRMFALISLGSVPPWVNLKCNPEWASALREHYPAIRPGYHMNKRHWNTVVLDGTLPHSLIREMIRHSYECVIAGLPRTLRECYRKELSQLQL
ncbi:MAG: hypothetical protein AA908_05160 [Chlorobi bacterium NICIL-2]|jgi:predicted DNA-binding protein (MmcQ/YjbR family)|nr:MAG: hypothetical protein AA908_05160 [Chlorobi bacterium NICIL-2]